MFQFNLVFQRTNRRLERATPGVLILAMLFIGLVPSSLPSQSSKQADSKLLAKPATFATNCGNATAQVLADVLAEESPTGRT